MRKWGYLINKDNQFDIDAANMETMAKIIELEPSLSFCYACGTCSATCSAGNFSELSLRKLNILILRGETTKTIRDEISRCMLCGKCTLVCPRGVNTRNLILSIKKVLN
jgi:heterodisulfide reductase subunit C